MICGIFLFSKTSFASEGTVQLNSITDKSYRCFAASILMENETYKLTVTCRDLIYPPQPDLFAYMVWGTPLDGDTSIKFGELGKGKASFETRTSFSNLFVTIEKNNSARKPEGQVVMRGAVEPITFLNGGTISTPTEVPAIQKVETEKVQTTGQKLLSTLGRTALVIFLAIVVAIVFVIFLTRSRRA